MRIIRVLFLRPHRMLLLLVGLLAAGILNNGPASVAAMFSRSSASSSSSGNVFVVQRSSDKPLSPVIFVPGDGGSQLDAKLNKPEVLHYVCAKKADFYNIWLNLELLVPVLIDCWIDNISLRYDAKTRRTSNAPGVTTRVPGWGNPDVVEWLDPTHASAGGYFKDIGNALVAAGYVRNLSLRGAPYDFRKGPNENAEWFADMKELVEETYAANGNQPITFIVHSMGGPMTLLFLQLQVEEWKDKHVARIIALAGAWGGSVKALKVYAMGDDLGSYALNAKVMRAEQITNPSLAWLLPSHLFWNADEVLVQTLNKTYKMGNLDEYFDDLNYPNGWEMRKDLLKFTEFTPPGVEVHCVYGKDVPTVERLNYTKTAYVDGATPQLQMGQGDGTVNLRSLSACGTWTGMREMRGKNVTTLALSLVDHMQVLSDRRVVQYVLNTLLN